MKFNIASYPGRENKDNPYINLFYDALEKHEISMVGELKMDMDWLNSNTHQLGAIHLHWPENLWRDYLPAPPSPTSIRYLLRSHIPGLWRFYKHIDHFKLNFLSYAQKMFIKKVKGYLYFKKFLLTVHKAQIKIIWTFHNAESHEGSDLIDRLGYKYLAKYSDLVIFHSKIAQKNFLEQYQYKGQSIVMPIGNYDGTYPPPRSREIILKELGLCNDLPIVSFLGSLRAYKGLDTAKEAIKLLDGKVQFLCAGSPHPRFASTSLQSEISNLHNTIFISKFLSNQEFSDYTSISDCILMPYKKITGSSALLAALTLSRGVVASDLPYFREILAGSPNAGKLVRLNDPRKFADGINDYLKIPSNIRNQKARDIAELYAWEEVTKPVIDILHSWVK